MLRTPAKCAAHSTYTFSLYPRKKCEVFHINSKKMKRKLLIIVYCFKRFLSHVQVTAKMADPHQSKVIFRGLVAWVTGETQYTAMIAAEVRTVEGEQRGLVSSSVTIVTNETN